MDGWSSEVKVYISIEMDVVNLVGTLDLSTLLPVGKRTMLTYRTDFQVVFAYNLLMVDCVVLLVFGV